jgi:hypothetical protein
MKVLANTSINARRIDAQRNLAETESIPVVNVRD